MSATEQPGGVAGVLLPHVPNVERDVRGGDREGSLLEAVVENQIEPLSRPHGRTLGSEV